MTSGQDPRWTPIRSAEAIGRAVRRRRLEVGLTQADLAQLVPATRQAIVGLERGHETRALQLVFDTLAALGIELAIRPRTR